MDIISSNFFMLISNDRRFGRICAPFWRGMMELSSLTFGSTRQKVKLYYTRFSLLMKAVQDTTILNSNRMRWTAGIQYILSDSAFISQDIRNFSLVHC